MISMSACRLLKESEGLLTEQDLTSGPDPVHQSSLTTGALMAP